MLLLLLLLLPLLLLLQPLLSMSSVCTLLRRFATQLRTRVNAAKLPFAAAAGSEAIPARTDPSYCYSTSGSRLQTLVYTWYTAKIKDPGRG